MALLCIPLVLACSGGVHSVRTAYYSNRSIPVENSHKYYDNVVRLHTTAKEEGKPGSQATGFAVTTRHLVTAGHFCENAKKGQEAGELAEDILIIGANFDGSLYELGTGKILAQSKDHDLCLIVTEEEHGLVPLPILGSMDVLETEDVITVVGAPKSYFPVRRNGFIISTESPRFKWKDMLFLAIDIQKGSSGSPVLWNGFVIGVIVILPYDLHDAALAVRGDHLLEFIQDNVKAEPEEK